MEQFYCADCNERSKKPFVNLDRHGRCEQCGSDQVMPAFMPEQDRVAQGIIYWP
jgi:hypothetical protein